MNLYRICRAVYKPIRGNDPWHTIGFETLLLLKADSAEHALKLAKKRGIGAPVVEPAKERLQ